MQEQPMRTGVNFRHARDITRFNSGAGCDTIAQNVSIKFDRNSPLLVWFRNDLTTANIRMQSERPSLIFVN